MTITLNRKAVVLIACTALPILAVLIFAASSSFAGLMIFLMWPVVLMEYWYIAFLPFFCGCLSALYKHNKRHALWGLAASIPFSFLCTLYVVLTARF